MKTAIITGANQGLGYGAAEQLGLKGYNLIICGRRAEEIEKAKKSLQQKEFNVTAYTVDVAHKAQIDKIAGEIKQKHSRVDVLINNAGVFLDEPATNDRYPSLQASAKNLETSLHTNTLAPFYFIQHFLPMMIEHNYGRIVNVSSGMGQLDEMNGGFASYRISKTALNAVTKLFSEEVKDRNILINSICPGWVQTRMGGASATRTISEGVSGILWAATLEDGGPSGGFFRDGKKMKW